jgi:hypothetical protein
VASNSDASLDKNWSVSARGQIFLSGYEKHVGQYGVQCPYRLVRPLHLDHPCFVGLSFEAPGPEQRAFGRAMDFVSEFI